MNGIIAAKERIDRKGLQQGILVSSAFFRGN